MTSLFYFMHQLTLLPICFTFSAPLQPVEMIQKYRQNRGALYWGPIGLPLAHMWQLPWHTCDNYLDPHVTRHVTLNNLIGQYRISLSCQLVINTDNRHFHGSIICAMFFTAELHPHFWREHEVPSSARRWQHMLIQLYFALWKTWHSRCLG